MQIEHIVCCIGLAIGAAGLAPGAAAAQTGPAEYNKVETFQPGKKYNCIPTPDRKGWNCQVVGKGGAQQPIQATANQPAPPADAPAPAPAATEQASAPAAPQASELPGYLTNAASRRRGAPFAPASAPAASAPATAPTKRTPTTRPAPARQASAPPAAAPVAAPQAPPASADSGSTNAPRVDRSAASTTATQPPPNVPAAPADTTAAGGVPIRSQQDFLALPGQHFVVELGHAPTRAGLFADQLARQLNHANVYVLRTHENDVDQWLLLWGDFPDLEAARMARTELLSAGAVTPGWPRRVEPLQTEARRAESAGEP